MLYCVAVWLFSFIFYIFNIFDVFIFILFYLFLWGRVVEKRKKECWPKEACYLFPSVLRVPYHFTIT